MDLETKPEFIKSQQFFNNLLKERKHILGEHCVIAIEHLIADLISKDQFLFNYNFINKCTLGFKGDSIVESSFSATKRGHTVVSTRRRIDRSAMNMVNHVAERSRRENSKKCHDQYREVCWTRSGVKDILTTYALGIFCKNFDFLTHLPAIFGRWHPFICRVFLPVLLHYSKLRHSVIINREVVMSNAGPIWVHSPGMISCQ